MAHATRDDLMQRLTSRGIQTTTVEHQPVFTVEESDTVNRSLPGGHTKNLFFKDAKGRLWLVVADAHLKLDLKALPAKIGSAKLSFGKPDLLMEVLGVTPGSVTALALINDVERRVSVVIDRSLMAHTVINCHPLTNTATTAIGRDDLIAFIKATGHEPMIVDIGA
jgi:Ala-tRNA(Pro) deacylase